MRGGGSDDQESRLLFANRWRTQCLGWQVSLSDVGGFRTVWWYRRRQRWDDDGQLGELEEGAGAVAVMHSPVLLSCVEGAASGERTK